MLVRPAHIPSSHGRILSLGMDRERDVQCAGELRLRVDALDEFHVGKGAPSATITVISANLQTGHLLGGFPGLEYFKNLERVGISRDMYKPSIWEERGRCKKLVG